MQDVITVGETMVSFVPSEHGALRYVSDFKKRIAGAESNLAIGLSKLGHKAGWISRLGNDELGYFVRNMIRSEGVDTSQVIFDQEHRTGLMIKETNFAKESKVYYYRENSAASFLCKEDLPLESLKKAKIIHLTGITPVLSDSCKEMIDFLIQFGKENKILVSFDPNIRKRLWKGIDHSPYIQSITLQSDIIMMGLDEAETLFCTREISKVVERLKKEGKALYIAIKDGGNGAWVSNGKDMIKIPPYPCNVLEPIGAGDGFNAGFLAGILQKESLKRCGEMGAIAGALATETAGDTEGYPTKELMETILYKKEEIYR